MYEEIRRDLYKVQVPLPHNPLKYLNSYIVKGDRNLIIDTGFNQAECREALMAGLSELKIDLEKTDIFITHMHADHSGLINELIRKDTRVYCSLHDSRIINQGRSPDYWGPISKFFFRNGFLEIDPAVAFTKHPAYKYGIHAPLDFTVVGDGSTIQAGPYRFTCVETPGHTPAHLCLYEAGEKLLISGDHILGDITPNITQWTDGVYPLDNYLKSLKKTYLLDVDLVLPGHRRPISDCKARIDELFRHHKNRLAEVLSLLQKNGSMTAYQVASSMKWSLSVTWPHFPIPQRLFAMGEALAHLSYLSLYGKAAAETRDDKTFWHKI